MIFSHTSLFRSLAMAGCIATAVVALTGCEDQQAQQIEQAKILLKSADAYHDQGQFRAAISELQSSLEISNTLEANIQLAEIFNELRQSASAEKLLKPLLTSYPDEVRYELSRSYLLRKASLDSHPFQRLGTWLHHHQRRGRSKMPVRAIR